MLVQAERLSHHALGAISLHGTADPPDPDADPPDPDHQIRIVVDQASLGSLTFVDSMGLPLILVGVGDPFVGDPFVGEER